MSATRTIRVTGKGQIKLKPDMMRITMTLAGLCPEYADTLQLSSQDTECIKTILEEFGIERSEVKTLNYEINPENERYEERKIYKYRLVGYRYEHILKVEFDSDNERLGRILYALAHCPVDPRLDLRYTVKDKEAAKNALLGKAVADAKEKAAVLSQAAGVGLGDIQSIDYSWGEISFETRPMGRAWEPIMATEASPTYAIDIEPEDIDVSDTVTVVWEIL